jgi:hypothetical protein
MHPAYRSQAVDALRAMRDRYRGKGQKAMPKLTKPMLLVGVAAICALALSEGVAQAQAIERDSTRQLTAQRRPRIIIRPGHRHLSPDAKRYCTSWLQKEYRPSGTVITPQMRCWWED